MERKFVMVAFSDINGFSAWRRRATTTPEVSEPFLRKFYEEIEGFVIREDSLMIKYLGDGYMAIKEWNGKTEKSRCAADFIRHTGAISSHLSKLVQECGWPPPEGFRTRLTCGYVDKIMVVNPYTRKGKVPEYIGHVVNLAQKLLNVESKISYIIHESIAKLIKGEHAAFKFKAIPTDHLLQKMRSIDPEDLEGLWEVEFS